MPKESGFLDRLSGVLLVALTVVVAISEWSGLAWADRAAAVLSGCLILVLTVQVRRSRQIFVAVGIALVLAAFLSRTDWGAQLFRALSSAAFIAGFFAALTTLRNTADSSPAIQRAGRFLAQQPPGRRYAALTAGGQVFAILLSYGAIALLGSLASGNARHEPDPEIRAHRTRRMLLAVQRGFVSTLPWSPLAFAMAISTSLIPGATWAGAVLPALGSGVILAGLGWALDTIFKPRLSRPAPPRGPSEDGWSCLLPLLGLLAALVILVGSLHLVTGLRAVAVVLVVVPLMSLAWAWIQAEGPAKGRAVTERAHGFLIRDLPAYRGELVLLMMAGFIGTLGAVLLSPIIARAGIDLSDLPAWVILVGLVWVVPLTGQLGMNPILSVSLLAPIIPEAAAIGVRPSDIIVAITSGWALSGASSPFTATTLLVGSFGNVSALHVGLRWNGVYTALSGLALSVWVVLVAMW